MEGPLTLGGPIYALQAHFKPRDRKLTFGGLDGWGLPFAVGGGALGKASRA